MEANYNPLITFEEKNPRKFSIEIENPNFLGLSHPQFEVEKGVNSLEEEKPTNYYSSNKIINNLNSTNIFLISNIKESNSNENKGSSNSKNIIETNNINNNENILEEKQKNSSTSKEIENNDSNSNEYNSGRWTNEEHQKFIEGIFKYGNEWKRVQSIIKTRSSTQARSHAQKFFLRMKKEINPKILSDENLLLQYIINSTNKSNNYTTLTNEQKERLFSVIRSNLKPEENQNKNNNLNNSLNLNKKEKDGDSGLNDINEEEESNLGYNKDNLINKKLDLNNIGEKRKITFCSRKRKNSSDYILNPNDNKIFSIKKDLTHKKSMEIAKSGNNFINKLAKNNTEIKQQYNELNNNYNYINNSLISNNINNNLINNDKYINNNKCGGNFNNFNNNNPNYIIQNNIYNIINNFNGINNQTNFNSNINVNNNPINISQNNFQNNNLNNDSIIYNNIDSFKSKDKNIKNNLPEPSESIFIGRNPLENYTFFNNENFFPNKNTHFDNFNKNYENVDPNDPFNLKFENENVHNYNNNDNNTIINENLDLNHNLEEGHDIYDYDYDKMNNMNNINDRSFED